MLAKRLIPCLDVRDGRVVKGVQFLDIKDAGDPVELASFYDREGADELVFLDITASAEGRRAIVDIVRRTAETIFIPFTVGGGIDSVDFMRELLHNGAEKVSLNTSALKNPELIRAGANQFGRQCIVVAIDARRRGQAGAEDCQDKEENSFRVNTDDKINTDDKSVNKDNRSVNEDNKGEGHSSNFADNKISNWEVYSHGGRYPTGKDVVQWAIEAESMGAGEILLTSMDADGTQDGYDNELLAAVVDAVSIPVIASGGAGDLIHLVDALREGKAHAVLVASILHYGKYTIADIKDYLARQGLPIRPVIPYPAETKSI